MQEVTPEMKEQWKCVWNEYKSKLRPNRRTGNEILEYIKNKYPLRDLANNEKYLQVVSENVLRNQVFTEKLPAGKSPVPIAFIIENAGQGTRLYEMQDEAFMGNEIFVGVDIESGFYCVEGSSLLWDELCAFQGLAEYISCLKKFSLLDSALM